jgi:hypothetical protein
MNDTRQQETRDLYTRALSTITYVLDVLRDEPDPDGALAELADRVEAEREWVRSLMVLGKKPVRPPNWLWLVPAPPKQEARLSSKRRAAEDMSISVRGDR